MRLLLDTHALVWWDEGVHLRPEAAAAIRGASDVFVSAVVGWEITIKAALGRFRVRRDVATVVAEAGFIELPVTLKHVAALAELPLHHRDPFDRMLAAQAKAEHLTFVTRDAVFRKYGIRLVRA